MFHCHIKKLLRILLLTQRCDRSQQDPFGKDDRIDGKKKQKEKSSMHIAKRRGK